MLLSESEIRKNDLLVTDLLYIPLRPTDFQLLLPMLTFVAVLIMNGILIRVILRKHRKRQLELQASTLPSSPSKTENNAYKMLAACALLYLLTQFPSFVANILELLELTCVHQMTSVAKS